MQEDSLVMKIYKRVTRAATGMIAGAATGAIVGAIVGPLSYWTDERIMSFYPYGFSAWEQYQNISTLLFFDVIGVATMWAIFLAILGAIFGPIFFKRNLAKLGMIYGWVGVLIIRIITEEIYLVWVNFPSQTFGLIGIDMLGAMTGAFLGNVIAGIIEDRFSKRIIGRFEGVVVGVFIGVFSAGIKPSSVMDGALGGIYSGIVGLVGALEPRD